MVHSVLEAVRDHFRGNGLTQTVRYGDFAYLDTDKTLLFPLAHMEMISATVEDNIVMVKLRVGCFGYVDRANLPEPEDEFFSDSNLHDVINTQFVLLAKLIKSFTGGDLYSKNFRLANEDPELFLYENRFENMLAGWVTELDIIVPSTLKYDGDGC